MASELLHEVVSLASSYILFGYNVLKYLPCFAKYFGNCRVSFLPISWSCGPLIARPLKPTFVVVAESYAEGGAEASDNVEETVFGSVEPLPKTESEQVSDSDPVVDEPRPPRKPRVKLGDIMGILNPRAIEASDKERPTPDIRTGNIVEIKLTWLFIKKDICFGCVSVFRRRISYSPNIKEIKVVSHRQVRRARLYYLRDKLPRLSTLK